MTKSEQIKQQIEQIKEQLHKLPDGKLICVNNPPYYKWYQNIGSTRIYIQKKNRKLAEKLALKKYLSIQLDELEKEMIAINFYLRHHKEPVQSAEKLLTLNSGYKELLSTYFKPDSQELTDWMSASYEKNTSYPEQLTYQCLSGNLVRSKSEAIIDMYLSMYKIPYRYEAPLQLGDTTIFPDFTIMHPLTRELYYWEHFGMMDNPKYCRNACSKIQLYASNGIVPSVQLISTYETQEHPLDISLVEKTIAHYFL